MEPSQGGSQPVKAQLSLWDAVSIIIGIVIGAGIYETAPLILSKVSGPAMGLAVWAAGGLLSLIGALCYAELATTYRRSGGDYVYQTRAFGPWAGFMFGWAQLAVIRTSSIGLMAFVFADYAAGLWNLGLGSAFAYAVLAVVAITLLNILGVVFGKVAQNVLTTAKVLGLGGILLAGFLWGQGQVSSLHVTSSGSGSLGLAMIFVLYTYGGWNDAAFVAAEVRDQRRNVPRALILGTAAITIIYVLINAAYMLSLGFENAQHAQGIAAQVVRQSPLGEKGLIAISLLVMVSALGAVNGIIFTGSRVYATLGEDHSFFAWLGRWHPRLGSPLWSLVVQAVISLAWIALVSTETGRNTVNRGLALLRVSPVEWKGHGGFETLLAVTAPVFWFFFLLTGLALFVLRLKDRGIERPFPVPLFPLLPLIFCGMCVYMLYSAINYIGPALTAVGAAPLLLGIPLYCTSSRSHTAV